MSIGFFMIVRGNRRGRLSSSERVNSYKACSCGLCRDFLCGGGYDLGTKFLFIKNYRFVL